MEKQFGLSHLFMTVFLYCFANFMVVPAKPDVTMAALCPGKDECSLAIYLTGAQQAIIGLGSLVVMPLIGNLSDTYGRKVMLTVPMTFGILPLVILACSRTKYFFYTYYVLKTVIAIVTEGCVQFLALAYVVAASMAVISLVYMRVFLPESMMNSSVCAKNTETTCLLEKAPTKKWQLFKNLPSVDDTICLLRTSSTFSKAAAVAFFISVADVGIHASLNYYLKAQFHFNKDQFADLMIIFGIAGSISQMILMPILTPLLGEEKMLSIGLFFSCARMVLYSTAWAPWVPYAADMISVVDTFAMPCLRSIASKQIGPNEQGKAQGCITGICSFANIVSPLAFSPLTALFLSDSAPFYFPGFSIMCSGFAAMIAFIQSIMIRATAPPTSCSIDNSNSVEP
ncbi:Major facilitator superfamily protein [Forsythia ovata]|uniref:Major facilitator superfamily protein n=1 Tax=Forsythia ovata TaxID=205694 RepID=A0ABD1VL99_9LAMI